MSCIIKHTKNEFHLDRLIILKVMTARNLEYLDIFEKK